MLFHGTSEKGIAGILETGYRNSVKGDFRRGVYQPKVLTWCLYIPVEETLKNLLHVCQQNSRVAKVPNSFLRKLEFAKNS